MGNTTWKNTEREVARRLRGHRVGCTGRATPDVVSSWLVAEVKHRKTLPGWLKEAVRQATAAGGESRPGILVLHQTGDPHDDDLVVMTMAAFTKSFDKAELD